jgi:hypothetical protein
MLVSTSLGRRPAERTFCSQRLRAHFASWGAPIESTGAGAMTIHEAPTNLTASDDDKSVPSCVTVKWTKSTGATSYVVYRNSTPTFPSSSSGCRLQGRPTETRPPRSG